MSDRKKKDKDKKKNSWWSAFCSFGILSVAGIIADLLDARYII